MGFEPKSVGSYQAFLLGYLEEERHSWHLAWVSDAETKTSESLAVSSWLASLGGCLQSQNHANHLFLSGMPWT